MPTVDVQVAEQFTDLTTGARCHRFFRVILALSSHVRNLPLLVDYVNSNLVSHIAPNRPDTFWSGAWVRHTLTDVPPKMEPEEREFARRLGSSIRAARLDRDISQESLAEAASTSVGTIGRWERGVNAPKSYQLAKVWAYLDAIEPLDAADLFDPVDDLSDLERRQMERAAKEGIAAAWRPRRRATKRDGDAPGEPPPPRPKKSR